jgi:choline dehydrogenase-like flavoprotein
VIIDFSVDKHADYEADLCIVGAGIAAYTLLSAFRDSPLRILVVERGGMKQDLNQEAEKACTISGHTFEGHLGGRYFGLGGTSAYWGGQSLPLEEFDLAHKDWVAYSGWPIRMDDIKPYFGDAEKLFQVDPIPYTQDVFNIRSLKPFASSPSAIKYHFSKWSPRPNFKPDLQEKYSSHGNTHILLNAVVSTFDYEEESKEIKIIHIRNQTGKKGTVRATRYVLAAGGIENARLLLASPALPANKWVGLMFQDHPTAQVATVYPTDMKLLQRYFGYFFRGRTRMLPRMSLSAEAQKQGRLLAATSFIQFLPKEGSVLEAAKQVYRSVVRMKKPPMPEVKRLLVSFYKIGELFPMLKAYVSTRSVYVPDSIPRLTVMLEQVPSENSYIRLSETRDTYGIPMAEIHWEISDETVKTLRTFCSILDAELKNKPVASIEWDSWLNEDDQAIKQHLTDAFHHMGTTRMSSSAETGVVDEQCRMHGVNNLYVTGSSVFPTSGHSNPTFTAMALTLRLGKHLKEKFRA